MSEKPPLIPRDEVKLIEVEVLPPEGAERQERARDIGAGAGPMAGRFRVALAVAMLVDAVEIGLFPLFAPGFASVANVTVDSVTFLFFILLLGWHPALLPGFILEQVPLLGMAPTWTIAVWLASRRASRPEPVPPQS